MPVTQERLEEIRRKYRNETRRDEDVLAVLDVLAALDEAEARTGRWLTWAAVAIERAFGLKVKVIE